MRKSKIRKALKIASTTVICGILAVILTFTGLCIHITGLYKYSPQGDFDAVMILGAGLWGTTVSPSLKHRLDAAAGYILEHDIKTVLVSGGQGPNELVSEAYAMKEYLVKSGVDEDSIIMEDKSTSTRENFSFSKPLLDEALGDSYRVLFVTNDFHCPRSGLIAKKTGLDADFLPAEADKQTNNWNLMREYLALGWFLAYEMHV